MELGEMNGQWNDQKLSARMIAESLDQVLGFQKFSPALKRAMVLGVWNVYCDHQRLRCTEVEDPERWLNDLLGLGDMC